MYIGTGVLNADCAISISIWDACCILGAMQLTTTCKLHNVTIMIISIILTTNIAITTVTIIVIQQTIIRMREDRDLPSGSKPC